MNPYFLVIPLPPIAQTRLASLCYGLPQVRWTEEDHFHVILRQFGPLADHRIAEIREKLEHLFFHPFPLVLQGMNTSQSKGKRGIIWVGVIESIHLSTLKKEINRQLSGLQFPQEERSELRVSLGYFDRINPERFGDYLSAHAGYQSLPIHATKLLLVRSIQTPKRIIYETIEEYHASPFQQGED